MQTFCSLVIRNAFVNTKPSLTEFHGKCDFKVIWGGFKSCQKVYSPIFKQDVPFVWQNMIKLLKFRKCELDVYHMLHAWWYNCSYRQSYAPFDLPFDKNCPVILEEGETDKNCPDILEEGETKCMCVDNAEQVYIWFLQSQYLKRK